MIWMQKNVDIFLDSVFHCLRHNVNNIFWPLRVPQNEFWNKATTVLATCPQNGKQTRFSLEARSIIAHLIFTNNHGQLTTLTSKTQMVASKEEINYVSCKFRGDRTGKYWTSPSFRQIKRWPWQSFCIQFWSPFHEEGGSPSLIEFHWT